jgi:hypothetical protein
VVALNRFDTALKDPNTEVWAARRATRSDCFCTVEREVALERAPPRDKIDRRRATDAFIYKVLVPTRNNFGAAKTKPTQNTLKRVNSITTLKTETFVK